MSKLILIQDTIDFAKELAFEMELRSEPPSDDDILGALHVMDARLKGAKEDIRAMFAIEQAFAIPDFELKVDLMSDKEYADSVIDTSVVRARLDGFRWVGNIMSSGFGLRLFGIDVVEPKKNHIPTAFVPLESVNIRLAV